MNIVFWMDLPSACITNKDTTYLLIYECLKRHYSVFYANKAAFQIEDQDLKCNAVQIKKFERGQPIPLGKKTGLTDKTIDIIWIRCDPPR